MVKEMRTDYNEELFGKLKSLRDKIAEEKKLKGMFILNDNVLRELAYFYPTDKDLFLAIKGLGESKYEKYGEDFLKIIKDSDLKDIDKRHGELKATIKPEKPKVNVRERTAMRKARVEKLIIEKKSIDEMAVDLELTNQTIVNYIDKLIKDGKKLDVQYIKDSVEGYNDIVKSFEKHGMEKLGPVYGDFAGMVEYSDVALVRVLMSA